MKNNVKKLRLELMLSRATLAKEAGITTQTITRIEAGHQVRLATMREIIMALGFKLEEREKVFPMEKEGEVK